MLKTLKIIVVTAVIVLTAVMIFKDWHFVSPKDWQVYQDAINAEPTFKVDTFIKHDTIRLPGKTVPVPVYRDTALVVDIDTTKLMQYVNDYFAQYEYADTLKSDKLQIAIKDYVTQNAITQRDWDVLMFKADTVIREVQTTTIKVIDHDTPRNNVDFHYAFGTFDKQSIDMYWLSYTRQFGKGSLQWRVGLDAGCMKQVDSKAAMIGAHVGVAF